MSNSKIRNFGLKHYNLSLVLAVAVLFGLCLLNHWIFLRLFDRQYVLWFIKTGPLIALVTTVASTAWGGLDKVPGLISANPYAYVGSYLQVISLTGAGILPHLELKEPFDDSQPVGLSSLICLYDRANYCNSRLAGDRCAIPILCLSGNRIHRADGIEVIGKCNCHL